MLAYFYRLLNAYYSYYFFHSTVPNTDKNMVTKNNPHILTNNIICKFFICI